MRRAAAVQAKGGSFAFAAVFATGLAFVFAASGAVVLAALLAGVAGIEGDRKSGKGQGGEHEFDGFHGVLFFQF